MSVQMALLAPATRVASRKLGPTAGSRGDDSSPSRLAAWLARMHALLTYVLAVATAVALDYSLFKGFHISVRDAWMGSWFTGFIIGSLATVWRVIFGYLGSSEGETPEQRHLHKVAA